MLSSFILFIIPILKENNINNAKIEKTNDNIIGMILINVVFKLFFKYLQASKYKIFSIL